MAERDPRLDAILGPAGPELTCDECFARLDEFVELEVGGADAERAIPGMREHLAGCPACHEDHESLLAFVAGERAT